MDLLYFVGNLVKCISHFFQTYNIQMEVDSDMDDFLASIKSLFVDDERKEAIVKVTGIPVPGRKQLSC